MDGGKKKFKCPQRKIKMPKFQEPKFGISLRKGKGPEPEISSPKPEAELAQLKMTLEIADFSVQVPVPELKFDMSDSGGEGAVEGSEEKGIKLKGEHEIKAEEVEAKEHQGCF